MLEIKNIKKIYSNNRGLKNLNFTVEPGSIIALVGPNGSGKSTSLKIISGILKQDSGECLIFGENTFDTNTKKYIGYLPDEPFLYEKLSPIQFFNFVQSMKGMDVSSDIGELLKEFGLWDYRNNKIKSFSLGMKKRVSLISSLIGKPKLLVLDEPTNGFDTKSILLMKKYIYELKKNGSIIIISSHILEFIANIADKTIFIKSGDIVEIANNNDNIEKIYEKHYL